MAFYYLSTGRRWAAKLPFQRIAFQNLPSTFLKKWKVNWDHQMAEPRLALWGVGETHFTTRALPFRALVYLPLF